jgi:Tfp pilus assembly protein PilF
MPSPGELAERAEQFGLEEEPDPRRKRLILLLVVLVVLAAGGGLLEWLLFRSTYYFRKAQTAQQRRDFAQARSQLQASLAADLNNANSHFLLARVHRQVGAFEDADDELNECERLEGASPRIALERGLLQVAQGIISQSNEMHLQHAVASGHPDALQILEALSVGCLTSYRFSSAHGYLSEWIDRDPDNYQPHLWRSLANERIEDYSSALDDARRAATLAPGLFEAQLRLGETLLLNSGHQEAAQVYSRLSGERPGHPLVELGLARSLALDRIDEAVRILDNLLARYPNETGALLERGRLALQRGELGRAEGWLLQAARQSPADYAISYALLQCHRQQGKDTRAEQEKLNQTREGQARLMQLEKQLRRAPYDLSVRCEIARICLEQENDKDGLQWLKSVVKIDPGYALANQMLTDYYEKNGQPALAAPYRAAAAAAPR